jgi:hypothetical protein
MVDIPALTRQVQHNCDVSDARHAGIYSICGLAMRLRDLFKWEHDLPPWQESDSGDVLEWIGVKESCWERLADSDYEQLAAGDTDFDPFDSEAINSVLIPVGFYYGGGYAHSLKPTFFLALIQQRIEIEGTPVYLLGRELARDLLTLPAMIQNGQVVLRREAARLHLWDKLLYLKPSGKKALNLALQALGVSGEGTEALHQHLDLIMETQTDLYARHEIGELYDVGFPADVWRQMIGDFPHTPVELLLRSLKDILADTHPSGALGHTIAHRNRAALGLYMAFFDGLMKQLCPTLTAAFDQFITTNRWEAIHQAAAESRRRAMDQAERLMAIYNHANARGDLPEAERQIVSEMRAKKLIR